MSRAVRVFSHPLAETVQRARRLAWRLVGKRWRVAFTRWRSPVTFIAVTGSSGKTVTVGLISYLLSGETPVQTQIHRNLSTDHAKRLQKTKRKGFYVGEIGASGPGTL